MAQKVKLKELVEAMELQFNDWYTFFNTKTGEIVYVSDDDFRSAEEDEIPDWKLGDLSVAIDILENEENYIELPTQFDIDEYGVMEDFCYSIEDGDVKDRLLTAIRGNGAFRRFKDLIIDFDLRDKWYAYRDERFKEIAIKWCRQNGIEWVE